MLSRTPIMQRSMASLSGSLQQQKKALRKIVKSNLRKCSSEELKKEESAIQAHILSAEWFKQSKALCAYLTCDALKEVDTSRIVGEVLKDRDSEREKQLFVPRIVDNESNMVMLKISSLADLTTTSMGIREPEYKDSDENPRKNALDGEMPIDLLLLPGLAFDRMGRRLGRGGGYYDKFLSHYMSLAREKRWNRPLLVALAYSVQIEGEIPIDDTDMRVDGLVLPSGILPVSEYGQKTMQSLTS